MKTLNIKSIYPIQHYDANVKKRFNKECQINIRSVLYIITLTAGIGTTRKFALLSERIGSVFGNTRCERRKRL